jgi:hypothetical protein
MGDTFKPKMFFLAAAQDGRLRLKGLPAGGPWDAGRLTYRTEPELDVGFSPQSQGWVIGTTEELDHVLSVSQGVPAPITLYVSHTLLSHVRRKWGGER